VIQRRFRITDVVHKRRRVMIWDLGNADFGFEICQIEILIIERMKEVFEENSHPNFSVAECRFRGLVTRIEN